MAAQFGIVNVQGHKMGEVEALEKEAKQAGGRRNSYNYIRPDMTVFNVSPPDKNGVVYDCHDWRGKIKSELEKRNVDYADRSVVLISGIYTASPEFWRDKYETMDGAPLVSRVCDENGNEATIEREFSKMDKRYHVRYYAKDGNGVKKRVNEDRLVRKFFRAADDGSEAEVPFHVDGMQIVKLNEEGLKFFSNCVDFHAKRYGMMVDATVHLDETSPHMHAQSIPIMESARVVSYAKDQRNNLLKIVHYDSPEKKDGEETSRTTNWSRFFYAFDVKGRDGRVVIAKGTECFSPKRGKDGKLIRKRVKVKDEDARASLQGSNMIGYRAQLSELQSDFIREVGYKYGLRRGKARYDEAHPEHAAVTQGKVNEAVDRAAEDAEWIRRQTADLVRKERERIGLERVSLEEEKRKARSDIEAARRAAERIIEDAVDAATNRRELAALWEILKKEYPRIVARLEREVEEEMGMDLGFQRELNFLRNGARNRELVATDVRPEDWELSL